MTEMYRGSGGDTESTIAVDLGSALTFCVGDKITIPNSVGEDSVYEVLEVEGNKLILSPPEDEFRREVRKITEEKDMPGGRLSRK